MATQARYLGTAEEFGELVISLMLPPVPAGAPGPPEEYREKRIEISKLIMKHPAATFFWIAQGDSMIGAGIHSGDYLVVDRAVDPTSGRIVIASVGGENTVKRLVQEKNTALLLPENPNYKPIPIDQDTGVKVFGVVTWVLHPV